MTKYDFGIPYDCHARNLSNFANQERSGKIEYHLSENRENDMVVDILNILVSSTDPIYDSFSLKSNKNTRGSYASFLAEDLQNGEQYKAYLNKLIPEQKPLEKNHFAYLNYLKIKTARLMKNKICNLLI